MGFLKHFEEWLSGYVGQGLVLWTEIFILVLASLTLGYLINKVILILEDKAGETKTV